MWEVQVPSSVLATVSNTCPKQQVRKADVWSDWQTHIILICFFHFFLIVNTDHTLLALGEAQGIQMKGTLEELSVQVGWVALAVNDN